MLPMENCGYERRKAGQEKWGEAGLTGTLQIEQTDYGLGSPNRDTISRGNARQMRLQLGPAEPINSTTYYVHSPS